ncbi:GPP34 family phosphoprotein [Nonomuraea aridisoli]|uniref:GPP34 family phosphoprotein n=1 Tax=Nonomuraea aridisoli TaxID=2070368 RepID=A0A2W2DPZ8_9ACTN|nr:GPP34 family phosphoprotein [Nonomuraea aridisoli]PZG14002.1 GPP34 family phosphoprotein [Nonomuraea aridisoli]
METLVHQDEPLTRSAFLLAFDLRKKKLVSRGYLGYLLRAAALADLLLAGHLADEAGKARAVSPPGAGAGSLQAALWEQIHTSPPRPWRRWVRKDHAQAFRLVRDDLTAARLIRVERHRILLFPIERITLRKPYVSRRLTERVSRALRGGRPVARLDDGVRVLAALAAAAELKTVMPPARELRKDRIHHLSLPVEPITTALRQTVEAAKGAQSAAG